MSHWGMNDEQRRGYDAAERRSRWDSYPHGEDFDYRQGWDERQREERSAQLRAEEEREQQEAQERAEERRARAREEERQQEEQHYYQQMMEENQPQPREESP